MENKLISLREFLPTNTSSTKRQPGRGARQHAFRKDMSNFLLSVGKSLSQAIDIVLTCDVIPSQGQVCDTKVFVNRVKQLAVGGVGFGDTVGDQRPILFLLLFREVY